MKNLILFVLTLLSCQELMAQECYTEPDEDFPEGNKYSYFGENHTPQGELRLLLIFAGLKDDTAALGSWLPGQFPTWAHDQFDTAVADIGNKENLSKLFYELSKFSDDPFKVTADFFPEFVEIDNDVKDISIVLDSLNPNTRISIGTHTPDNCHNLIGNGINIVLKGISAFNV